MAEDDRSGRLTWTAVAVVLIIVVSIVWVATVVLNQFGSAKDAATVLGVIISPLAGLGAAAFGIKQSSDAKAETQRVKRGATDVADRLRAVAEGRAGGPEVRGEEGQPPDSANQLASLEAQLRRLAD